jgi:RNA polymerase sigma-70 factor (ECF subfamily)
MAETDTNGDHPSDPFGSTQWSIVLAAGAEGTRARAALETLCAAYWIPVYGYVRSRVSRIDDAHDLTQSFFAELLERKTVATSHTNSA